MTAPLTLTVQLTGEQLEAIARRAADILAERLPAATGGYLDAAGAAEYLSTSRDRIYDLKALGKLPALQDGRRLLFRKLDLDEYLEASS